MRAWSASTCANTACSTSPPSIPLFAIWSAPVWLCVRACFRVHLSSNCCGIPVHVLDDVPFKLVVSRLELDYIDRHASSPRSSEPALLLAQMKRSRAHAAHPPGDEIYRHKNLSIWEVDGRKSRVRSCVGKGATDFMRTACWTCCVFFVFLGEPVTNDDLPCWRAGVRAEPVSARQAVPGPQDAALRCRALPLLRTHRYAMGVSAEVSSLKLQLCPSNHDY